MIQMGQNVVCPAGWGHDVVRGKTLPRDVRAYNHTKVAMPDVTEARFAFQNARRVCVPGDDRSWWLVKTHRHPVESRPAEIPAGDMLVIVDNFPRWISLKKEA